MNNIGNIINNFSASTSGTTTNSNNNNNTSGNSVSSKATTTTGNLTTTTSISGNSTYATRTYIDNTLTTATSGIYIDNRIISTDYEFDTNDNIIAIFPLTKLTTLVISVNNDNEYNVRSVSNVYELVDITQKMYSVNGRYKIFYKDDLIYIDKEKYVKLKESYNIFKDASVDTFGEIVNTINDINITSAVSISDWKMSYSLCSKAKYHINVDLFDKFIFDNINFLKFDNLYNSDSISQLRELDKDMYNMLLLQFIKYSNSIGLYDEFALNNYIYILGLEKYL